MAVLKAESAAFAVISWTREAARAGDGFETAHLIQEHVAGAAHPDHLLDGAGSRAEARVVCADASGAVDVPAEAAAAEVLCAEGRTPRRSPELGRAAAGVREALEQRAR